MKVFKILLTSCFMLIAAQSFAFAGSGKAIVPYWYAFDNGGTNYQSSHIRISNFTDHDLIVKISIYNKDATIYAGNVEYENLQAGDTEIGAGKSAGCIIRGYPLNTVFTGYAIIEWKNKDGDNDAVGLVSWADWAQKTPSRGFSIPVNNGMPF
ncbi:hypothetical protein [Desulfovibrio gilichinskyi]|uniref:Uncharacterized protein n=1 Tax=Desulfovibrio gilichinskyi TaxID=1519643 RepID=A0A1X7C9U3_9BACT|nr:hypothetical protein [Desulfovibrio gilichinskyi]SME92632.1 hypothetical protein SAMN06295933_0554 [Desulfovibrio gilichinskyi]